MEESDIEKLKREALLWWPEKISETVYEKYSVNKLVKSQDQFLDILANVKTKHPQSLTHTIEASGMSANLFLKHIMLLTDFGGEPVKRVQVNYKNLFPNDLMEYELDGIAFSLKVNALMDGSYDNLRVNPQGINHYQNQAVTPFYASWIHLLTYGGCSTNREISSLFSDFTLAQYLGNYEALQKKMQSRYIYVSKIISGSIANARGTELENHIATHLQEKLGDEFKVTQGATMKGINQRGQGKDAKFDILISRDELEVGIEISFQVTTNSTIERKARESGNLAKLTRESNKYIVYVLDGAGTFERRSALTTIMQNADLVTAASEDGLNKIAQFIGKKFEPGEK